MTKSPSEIARSFYDHFTGGTIGDVLSELFSADSLIDNPLPEPIRFAGRFHGPEGFAQYLKNIERDLQILEFNVDEFISEGERVVVTGSETSRVVATGRSYTMAWVHVFRIQNGRIAEFREYNDTAAMRAAFLES